MLSHRLSRRGLLASLAAPSREPHWRIWDDRPAPDWNEAYPIGNGRLGAMIFGGVESERLSLNEDTLYSDEPGHHELPLDITKRFEEVVALLRRGRHMEAEEIMNREWCGRSWPCYQPLGDLFIHFKGQPGLMGYRRLLDLEKAVAIVEGAGWKREYFASAADGAIFLRFAGRGDFDVVFAGPHANARMERVDDRTLAYRGQLPGFVLRRTLEWVEQRKEQWKYPELWERDGSRKPFAKQVLYGDEAGGRGMRFEARIAVISSDGHSHCGAAGLSVQGGRETVLALAVASSYNGYRRSPSREGIDEQAWNARTLAALSGKTWEALRSRHEADYTRLFGRCSLRLGGNAPAAARTTPQRIAGYAAGGDEDLAALYFHFARYLMISGSREGTQPLNLQGLWNKDVIPPWASGYTVNINTEMNYWPVHVMRLDECNEPLIRLVRELSETGRQTAKSMYRRRGWVAHHNTTLWRASQPVDNNAMPSFWPMSAGWLSLHIAEHWRFTQDLAFLKREYAQLRDAALFFLDWLVEDASGKLVTPAGHSPELRFHYVDPETGQKKTGGVTMGPAMDLAIVRETFMAAEEAALTLEMDAELRAEWAKARARLAPYRVGSRGNIEEWPGDLMETEPQHRHVSHLFGLHPGTQILPRRDARLTQAARKTLDLRGDGGTGWSMAWKVCFWARLLDGERAYRMVQGLLKEAKSGELRYNRGGVLPNLLCSHPPFQIDGNFGGAAGIAEMLLQSHAGEIELLPALPKAWAEGEFSGFGARGGFVVDAKWSGGKLERVWIASKAGRKTRLRYGKLTREIALEKGAVLQLNGDLK